MSNNAVFVSPLSTLSHWCQLCLWPVGSQWGRAKYLLQLCTQKEPGSCNVASEQNPSLKACFGFHDGHKDWDHGDAK